MRRHPAAQWRAILCFGAIVIVNGLGLPAGAAKPDAGPAPTTAAPPTTAPTTAPADPLPATAEKALARLADPSVLFIGELDKVLPDLTAGQRQAVAGRLHEALKAPDFEVRRRAALALGKLGNTGGVPALIDGLSAADARTRDN